MVLKVGGMGGSDGNMEEELAAYGDMAERNRITLGL
jgi:hypothetical protein